MRGRDAHRLRTWLSDPRVADVDPPTIERLRARLAAVADVSRLVEEQPHGTLVVREPMAGGGPPRRVLELDRHGAVLGVLRWTEDGPLGHAWVRIAEDSWLMVEPRAAYRSPWGLCDRLWHAVHPAAAAHVPLTLFEALDYASIDRIPVLLEPARLPAGAGAAVLNLVAALAGDAGRPRLAYRGPYPTEQLFLTLLESFRHNGKTDDPLAEFMAGGVEWSAAPHERTCPAPGVTVHLRGRVEKVVWRERLYYRPDWQAIHRHAPRRVRDGDGVVICSLWALGGVIEDHLRLDPGGGSVEVIAAPPQALPARPMPRAILDGIASAVAALGTAPLAPFVRQVAARHELQWASLEGDLVAIERSRLGVSHALRAALGRRLQGLSTRAERLALGLAALTELAHLLGDALRARAQAHLAALPADAQERALARLDAGGPPDGDDARRITAAVEMLIDEAEGAGPLSSSRA